jgi:hypothetical protein
MHKRSLPVAEAPPDLNPAPVESAPPPAPAAPEAPATGRRFVLRRRHLWVIAPLALIWIIQSLASIEPFDFWWNVTSGRIMFETGRFLADDVLVYTPVRQPYSNPQWGSQLLFYAFYALWPGLLLAVRVAIITATYGILFAVCFRRSRSLGWSAGAVLMAYITGLTNYGMRPQLFAFLPFVAFLWILERKREHPRALWALAPIMVFWVNVHGSYFLGWALIGIYAAATALTRLARAEGRAWLRRQWARQELLPMAVGALAAFVNPYGVGIVPYFFIATNDATARTLNIEWQPPTLYNGTGILFFANLGLFALLLLASRRPVGWREGLLLGAFGLLALLSIRNVIWWGWVTAPGMALSGAVLARRLIPALSGAPASLQAPVPDSAADAPAPAGSAPAEPLAANDIPALNWLIAAICLGAALVVTPLWRAPAKTLDKATPTAVAAWLAAQPVRGPLFNYMEWGGYLEWVLYPERQMFIDGRFEARQPQVWDDYLAISRGSRDWEARLAKYGVDTLILNAGFDKDLIPLVQASPAWQQVYPADPAADPTALVFYRR